MRISSVREADFPLLVSEGYKKTSDETFKYNCIAYAADVINRWWWPHRNGYWPPGVPREVNRPAFILAYQTIGYTLCKDGSLENGYEKIAIYELDGKPTHASKQLANGRWASKLGAWEDIEHKTTRALERHKGVGYYGITAFYMKRPKNEHKRQKH